MPDDLRELRNTTLEDDFSFEEEDDPFVAEEERQQRVDRLFLGMTAVERMFLSIFLFMNVCVLGLAFLLATHRIAL
jgi:hypothetical protein